MMTKREMKMTKKKKIETLRRVLTMPNTQRLVQMISDVRQLLDLTSKTIHHSLTTNKNDLPIYDTHMQYCP